MTTAAARSEGAVVVVGPPDSHLTVTYHEDMARIIDLVRSSDSIQRRYLKS